VYHRPGITSDLNIFLTSRSTSQNFFCHVLLMTSLFFKSWALLNNKLGPELDVLLESATVDEKGSKTNSRVRSTKRVNSLDRNSTLLGLSTLGRWLKLEWSVLLGRVNTHGFLSEPIWMLCPCSLICMYYVPYSGFLGTYNELLKWGLCKNNKNKLQNKFLLLLLFFATPKSLPSCGPWT
ncbi:hypothetical protein IFM89_038336, partial [Coptis chinensis]